MPLKINTPKFNSVLENATRASLLPDAQLESVVLKEIKILTLVAKGLSINEARIEKLTIDNAQLEKLSLTDVVMEGCDLSNAKCGDASFTRVILASGRMTGLDLNKSLLKDVQFKNCKLDMANFRFSKLVRVRFEDCVLSEADFQGADLTQVDFNNCLLENAEFSQCKLKEVDLRTSDIINLRGWEDLKGAVIDSTQLIAIAPALALVIGLKVEN